MAVSKLRNLRVDEALWAEAKRIADDRRETLSAVMKRALVEYVEQHGGDASRVRVMPSGGGPEPS